MAGIDGRPPLGLPRGSIRGFLALCVAGTAYWLIAHPARLADGALPAYLGATLPLALAYYFAHRSSGYGDGPGGLARRSAPPLWLPQGTVRTLLVLGFVAAVG